MVHQLLCASFLGRVKCDISVNFFPACIVLQLSRTDALIDFQAKYNLTCKWAYSALRQMKA